jgi:hypothetical protein
LMVLTSVVMLLVTHMLVQPSIRLEVRQQIRAIN